MYGAANLHTEENLSVLLKFKTKILTLEGCNRSFCRQVCLALADCLLVKVCFPG